MASERGMAWAEPSPPRKAVGRERGDLCAGHLRLQGFAELLPGVEERPTFQVESLERHGARELGQSGAEKQHPPPPMLWG